MDEMVITDTAYVEVWPEAAVKRGALRDYEMKGVEQQLHVTVSHAGVGNDHVIVIPLAAIANRMHVYGLDNETAAIEAILREHTVRLGDLEPEETETIQGLYGGLHSGVSLDCGTHIDNIVSEISETVREYHSERIPGEIASDAA